MSILKTRSGLIIKSLIKFPQRWIHSESNLAQPFALFTDATRQVFISQSNNIYTNLALEDWIYKNYDFSNKQLLLLWRNDPCVVIGRHQNPWTEVNLPYLRKASINLARRNSGGGTVYHDLGNLNCTFFMSRSEYDRRKNLGIVCAAIKKVSNLNILINSRDDIVLDETLKISGTASKLGHSKAYHHCTVLVDVDDGNLRDCLNSKAIGIESRSTKSVRVPIKNLRHADPSVSVDKLQEALGLAFLETDPEGKMISSDQKSFKTIVPEENWFPGVQKLRDELQSHEWIFGKTPNFKVSRRFRLDENVFEEIFTCSDPELEINLDISKGIIQSADVSLPFGVLDPELEISSVTTGLVFGPKLADTIRAGLQSKKVPKFKVDYLTNCVSDMVAEFA